MSCLVELYGAGLAEIVQIIGQDAEAGPRLMARLAADPLVESLLLVHDLHPLGVAERVSRAIDAVMPQLGAHAGRAEFAGLDEAGVIRIRLELSAPRRQAHAAAVQQAIEQAVADAAPDAAGVSFDVADAPDGAAAAADIPAPGGPGDPVTDPRAPSGLRRFVKRPAGPPPGLPPAIQEVLAARGPPAAATPASRTGAERCEMCREVLGERHGHVVDLETAVPRVHLPRVLPAVHPRGSGRRPVPGRARARLPRPGPPAHRRGLG